MKRELPRVVIMWAWVLSCPSAVFAQASIAGAVRDASGAVLPGVTVEASSPALIEKTRSVVTDATGQYKITDLRPGTYAVTFTLTGFSIVKREGIELTGSFVATVNADLKLGAIEESITVTGETPVVDVQSVKTQQVMTSDVLTAIPTARNYQNLHVLVPGVTVAAGNQDVGGTGGDNQIFFSAHGGTVYDSRLLLNGLNVMAPQVGGGRTMYVPSVGTSQEVSVTTSGGLGESETAGVVVNVITKDGGNAFKGTIFGTGATQGWASSNYDQALKDRGLRAPNNVKNVYDYEGALGGPIRKDQVWFFGQARYHGAANYIAGMFFNKNAGDPTKWTYDPDSSHQVVQDQYWLSESLRLTWQATPRNKVAASYEDQLRCVGCKESGTATSTPEAIGKAPSHPNNVGQLTWTSPITNRALLEAGFGVYQLRYGQEPWSYANDPALIRVTEQAGIIPGLTYRAPGTQIAKNWLATYATRASVTYTSGAHSMKFGYNGSDYVQTSAADSLGHQGLNYRFNNGGPNQLTELAHPFAYVTHAFQGGLFAQDQWTINRLTLGGGLRYDLFTTSYPDSQVGPTRFVPKALVFPAQAGTRLQDISPRMNAAYDISGNGKTAVKINLSKYLVAQDSNQQPLGPGMGSPINRLALSTTRSWNDANRNFVPDCDLLNLAANGECAAAANQNFGSPVFSTRFDPAVQRGFGVRPYDWNFDVSVQHELVPRVAVNVGYFRRWFGNFLVTANQATSAADYTLFNLPLPADSRLPTSGVVNGIANVNPAKFGLVDNLVTAASNYGNQINHWNGFDFAVNARLSDVLLQGGISTGRQSTDNCQVVAKLPSITPTGTPATTITPQQYCHVDGKFLTQVKLLGSYTVPRIDVRLAATLQNIPGEETQAAYNAPNASVAPLLGRNLSGGVANVTINLLPPQTFYEARVNQLDFRAAKIVTFAGRRAQIALDLFNALNSNVVETYNSSYNPTGSWQTPTLILPARVAKVSAQFDF